MNVMASHSLSHVDPTFIQDFGDSLRYLKTFLHARKAHPFIIAASGSIGWDMITANLTVPGDNVLVLNAGYFGVRFIDCLKTFDCNVTDLKVAKSGQIHDVDAVKAAVSSSIKYKMVTITQVDTSTGILSKVKEIADAVHAASPETLIVVDGVCSIGGEEFKFDDWHIDALMTASQKALGCPAGLSIQVLSDRALKSVQNRKEKIRSFYGNYLNWLPIMQSYESGKASYFATPAVHLVRSLKTSLQELVEKHGYDQVMANHLKASEYVKQKLRSAIPSVKFVPEGEAGAAHTMTACYFMSDLKDPALFLKRVKELGVVIAGGLLKDIPGYFRVGHMGYSVNEKGQDHLDRAIHAIVTAYNEQK